MILAKQVAETLSSRQSMVFSALAQKLEASLFLSSPPLERDLLVNPTEELG